MSYTTLGEDLLAAIEQYKPLTEKEASFWPEDENGRRIFKEMLSKDHPKGVRIFGEQEEEYVFRSEKIDEFWDYEGAHRFPDVDELIRFSIFLYLGFYRCVALILKRQWEVYIAKNSPEKNLLHELRSSDVATCKKDFQIEIDKIYEQLEVYEMASKADCDFITFANLIKEMILCDLHLYPNDSRELQAFSRRMEEEKSVEAEGDAEEKEAFWLAKCEWLESQEELGNQLLEVENARLENENVSHGWMSVFGQDYIHLQEQQRRKTNIERRIHLKEINPDFSLEEIEKQVYEEELRAKQALEELRLKASIPSRHMPKHFFDIPEDYLRKRDSESKKILRKIWRLIHPDILERNPKYKQLTEKQKEYIYDLRNLLSKIKPSEIGYHQGQIGWNHKSPEYLRDTLATVEKILTNSGIDTDVHMIIEGETLEKKITWLKKDIERLQHGIGDAKSERLQLLNDSIVRDMRRILACPEQYDHYKTELSKQTKLFQEEADSLEKQFIAMFEE